MSGGYSKAELFSNSNEYNKIVFFRGKEISEQLSKPCFLRSLKIAGFSPLLRSKEEKGAIFKIRKKYVALRVELIFNFL